MQSRVRFNRVLGKVPDKVSEGIGVCRVKLVVEVREKASESFADAGPVNKILRGFRNAVVQTRVG